MAEENQVLTALQALTTKVDALSAGQQEMRTEQQTMRTEQQRQGGKIDNLTEVHRSR